MGRVLVFNCESKVICASERYGHPNSVYCLGVIMIWFPYKFTDDRLESLFIETYHLDHDSTFASCYDCSYSNQCVFKVNCDHCEMHLMSEDIFAMLAELICGYHKAVVGNTAMVVVETTDFRLPQNK